MTSGGRFQGPRLSGTVLPLTGADWPRIRSDGTFAIDARACFRTTEGALIYVTYGGGLLDACPSRLPTAAAVHGEHPHDSSLYQFNHPFTLQTTTARYAWLNSNLR